MSMSFGHWSSVKVPLSQRNTGTLPHLDLTKEGHTQDRDQEHPTDARLITANVTQNTSST